tara:strand:+ start:222 stop:362 length:141 start_codon:yes stop_codon:yes gene_type:complete
MSRARGRVVIMQRKKKWVAYDKDGYVLVISVNKRIVDKFVKDRREK